MWQRRRMARCFMVSMSSLLSQEMMGWKIDDEIFMLLCLLQRDVFSFFLAWPPKCDETSFSAQRTSWYDQGYRENYQKAYVRKFFIWCESLLILTITHFGHWNCSSFCAAIAFVAGFSPRIVLFVLYAMKKQPKLSTMKVKLNSLSFSKILPIKLIIA